MNVKVVIILEKVYLDYTDVFSSNIIGKYENRPDNLHSLCLACFASSSVTKKANDEVKIYTVSVSNIDGIKLNPNIIVLNNELSEMRKHSRPCVICFHKVSKLKSSENYYLIHLQLHMPW